MRAHSVPRRKSKIVTQTQLKHARFTVTRRADLAIMLRYFEHSLIAPYPREPMVRGYCAASCIITVQINPVSHQKLLQGADINIGRALRG